MHEITRPQLADDDRFKNADGRNADRHADRAARATARDRTRVEYANNPYLKGISKTRAEGRVGVGPTVKVLIPMEQVIPPVDESPEDMAIRKHGTLVEKMRRDRIAKEVQTKFREWACHVGLFLKMQIADKASIHDGEGLIFFGENARSEYPVKLDCRTLDCHRLRGRGSGDRSEVDESEHYVDGVSLDDFGNATSYRLLKKHPGNYDAASFDFVINEADEAKIYPAKQIIHWFAQDFPEQHRGMPEGGVSVESMSRLRRYTEATIEGLETAASICGTIETEDIEDGASKADPYDTVIIDRNEFLVLTDGNKAKPFNTGNHVSNYGDVKKEIVAESARPIGVARNKALSDSSGYNYASGRLDHQGEAISNDSWRSCTGNRDMTRVFAMWFDEAIRVEDYLSQEARELIGPDDNPPYPAHVWFWPGTPHVDSQKEATANATKLATGQTTLVHIWAEQGMDWESEGLPTGAESLGLTVEEYQKALVSSIFGAMEPDEEDEDDDGETADEKKKANA